MDFSPSELETYRLVPGDLLLSEASGSPGEVGKPALWRGEIQDCCLQNTLIRVRTRGPLPSFLYYRFLHDAMSGSFADIARGVGIHHLGAQGLSEHVISVPPEDEQRRIVAELERRLSALDQMDAAITANLKRAERLRQAILKRAFEGKLVPQDPTDEPASVLLERIREERAGSGNGRMSPRRGRTARTPK